MSTNFLKSLLLLGSGELGKEVTIAAKRLGCKVIACDRYNNAPAMQVADESHVLDMTNPEELKKVIYKYNPDIIIPEIEAIAVDALIEIEQKGLTVIPNAKATKITMQRDKIRDLAHNQLGIKTAKFAYASSEDELIRKAISIGFPNIIKPIMSSSGKGQSFVKNERELKEAWNEALKSARGNSSEVIIEEFIEFEQEITLLTIRQKSGITLFCDPIGHEQVRGDYQSSWQPAHISKSQLENAKEIAKKITDNLGGQGLFGVEFFICKDEVIFSELSPRPHDTGLVTIISQNLNEFELHLRAILGIPIPHIKSSLAAASKVILSPKDLSSFKYKGIEQAMNEENNQILLFGKPTAKENRRMGVALAKGESIVEARKKADKAAALIQIVPT